MAGRKAKALHGPFAQLLAEHGTAPHQLADRLGVHVQSIYLLGDGRAKRYSKIAGQIADALGISAEEVCGIIRQQREAVRLLEFQKSAALLESILSAKELPAASDVIAYGPSRERLRELATKLHAYLDAGYGRPPLLKKTAGKGPVVK